VLVLHYTGTREAPEPAEPVPSARETA